MEGDAIFKKYSILVKKFVTEQNELSRMLASEVAVLVVEGMTTKDAAKIVTAVIDGIILKVFFWSFFSAIFWASSNISLLLRKKYSCLI